METTCDSVIEQIVQSIYATMLDIDMVRIDSSVPADDEFLRADIQISGGWSGTVLLELSPDVARASAAAMFQISEDEVTIVDQREVASELANMIGGNYKSLVPGPSRLSLPNLISGQDPAPEFSDSKLIEDVVLTSSAGFLRVQVWQHSAVANGRPAHIGT